MLIRLLKEEGGETIFVKRFDEPMEQPEATVWSLLEALADELVIEREAVRPTFEAIKAQLEAAG